MPYCRKCGTQLSDNAQYCYRCGTSTDPQIHITTSPLTPTQPQRTPENTPNKSLHRDPLIIITLFALVIIIIALITVALTLSPFNIGFNSQNPFEQPGINQLNLNLKNSHILCAIVKTPIFYLSF